MRQPSVAKTPALPIDSSQAIAEDDRLASNPSRLEIRDDRIERLAFDQNLDVLLVKLDADDELACRLAGAIGALIGGGGIHFRGGERFGFAALASAAAGSGS